MPRKNSINGRSPQSSREYSERLSLQNATLCRTHCAYFLFFVLRVDSENERAKNQLVIVWRSLLWTPKRIVHVISAGCSNRPISSEVLQTTPAISSEKSILQSSSISILLKTCYRLYPNINSSIFFLRTAH